MKRTLLILFLCFLSQFMLAQADQQWLQRRISISVQDKALEEVLKSLEHDLKGMVFAYLPGSFDVHRKVSVKLDSIPLRDVLDEIFADQQVECAEMRGKIFLKRKKKTNGTQGSKEGTGNSTARRRRTASGNGQNTTTGSTARVENSEAEKLSRQSAPAQKTTETAVRIGDSALTETKKAPAWLGTLPIIKAQSGDARPLEKVDLSESVPPEADESLLTSSNKEEMILPAKVPELLKLDMHQPQYRLRAFERPNIPPLPFDIAKDKTPFWAWLKMPAFLTKNENKPAKIKKAGNAVKNGSDSKAKKFRIYAGVGVAATPLGDGAGIKVGGRLVWLKDQSVGLGLAGYGFIGPDFTETGQDARLRLAGGYGGFHLEYSLNPDKPVHLSFPLVIGGGAITYVDAVTGNIDPNAIVERTQAIFVLEPGISLEMNVLRFLKIGLDVSYRYTSNSELKFASGEQILGPTDLNGISAGVTIKVGIF